MQIAVCRKKRDRLYPTTQQPQKSYLKRSSTRELTEHFFTYITRTHNFDNDAIITIIEQMKQNDMAIERKKEIFRGRETF